jgi:hypothetical protein
MSLQMHVSIFIKYSMMATLAGCPNAFKSVATAFCLSVKWSVFVAPIYAGENLILQYYDKDFGLQQLAVVVLIDQGLGPDDVS